VAECREARQWRSLSRCQLRALEVGFFVRISSSPFYQTRLGAHGTQRQDTMKSPKKKTVKAPAIGDRLLTLCEAAEVLRLNPRTLREYLKRGEIQGRIIGGSWKFRRADLDAFVENAPRSWDFAGKNNHGD